jgi:serine phosphatase RsbU (regulator of sigma subunit)
MPRIVLLHEGKAIPYPITEDETVIGRHPECGVQLQSNTVSRFHARVTRTGDEYFIEDMGSGNGTFVNGQQIPKDSPAAVVDQDRVKLGPLLLRFENDAAPKGSEKTSPPVAAPAAPPRAGDVDVDELGSTVHFSAEGDDEATIMGTTAAGGGSFGSLEVQPDVKLKAVIDITQRLCGETDLDKMLPAILDTLFKVFPHADRGCVLLKDEESGEMIPRSFKHSRDDEDATVRLSRTILHKVLTEKTGILSADAASDAQFNAAESISSLSIRSMMIVPMLNKEGEPIGVINIDTQNPVAQFTAEDLDLLLTIAGQASLTYENARLMKTYLEKQKQDGEMAIAMAVQRALLPAEPPKVDGYSFFASYDSAQAVGGDYYDAFPLTDDLICLSFGDVAGKGVPGALIMSRISSCVQNVMPFLHDPAEAIVQINKHMCSSMVEGRFVTYLLITIDTKLHKMRMVNAGHMSPMIRMPDGSIEEFDDDPIGLPVGVMEDYPYELYERDVNPGELFVLFTDGVDEAMNPAGDLYTLERMREFIKNGPSVAKDMGETLLADVRRHANGRPQNDDITIMTFSRDA